MSSSKEYRNRFDNSGSLALSNLTVALIFLLHFRCKPVSLDQVYRKSGPQKTCLSGPHSGFLFFFFDRIRPAIDSAKKKCRKHFIYFLSEASSIFWPKFTKKSLKTFLFFHRLLCEPKCSEKSPKTWLLVWWHYLEVYFRTITTKIELFCFRLILAA